MLCEKCKKELKENAKFCHYCGAVVQSGNEEERAVYTEPIVSTLQETSNATKKFPIWLIPVAVVLIVVIVVLVAGNNSGSDAQGERDKAVITRQEKESSKASKQAAEEAGEESASKEAAQKAAEESHAEEARRLQEEQEAKEALKRQKEEAVAAYEAFLRGERSACYFAHDGGILSGDKERYFYQDLVEESKQWWYNNGTELRAEYCYVEPDASQIPDMVLRVGEIEPEKKYYYNSDCYVLAYSEEELYLYYGFYDTYMHGYGKINSLGIIEEWSGLIGVGNYATVKALCEGQLVETVYQYVDYDFETVQWVTPGLHSDQANEIIQKAAQKYTELYQLDIYDYVTIREYDINGNYYYVYELNGDRREQLEALLTILKQEGMVFSDEETIAQLLESRMQEYGGVNRFEMDTPEWILWEGSQK